MIKRIAPIAFIFVCTGAAWGILGATILARAYSFQPDLKGRVMSTWGSPHSQGPPSAIGEHVVSKSVKTIEDGVLLFIITTLRGIELHPMNYFCLACAFFAFHLLLAYLVDQISVHAAFVICSAVSVFLVVSYLRLVVGMRFLSCELGTLPATANNRNKLPYLKTSPIPPARRRRPRRRQG